ncbi:uncharacterized protein LOC142490643 [Ascaphus truei]|uniref:uncharacterized protein LOC142490643 n=1 Tax=Ascaphus truei TaxID=8439 RepID=UPI003F599410
MADINKRLDYTTNEGARLQLELDKVREEHQQLQVQNKERETDLSLALSLLGDVELRLNSNEDELAAALSERRKAEGLLQDLRKDLESERAGRRMAEKQKCDLGKELESLKSERDATLDSTAAQQEVSQMKLEEKLTSPRQTFGSLKQSKEKVAVEIKSKDDEGEAALEHVLPEPAVYADYLLSYLQNPAVLTEEQKADMTQIEDMLIKEFIGQQLILIVGCLDTSEEGGRKRLLAVLQEMLVIPNTPTSLITCLVELLLRIVKDDDRRILIVAEIVSELREPIVKEQKADMTQIEDMLIKEFIGQQLILIVGCLDTSEEGDDDRRILIVAEIVSELREPIVSEDIPADAAKSRKLQLKIADLRVQLNKAKQTLEDSIVLQDFSLASELKEIELG